MRQQGREQRIREGEKERTVKERRKARIGF
jgi:hypothetical protein